MSDLEKIASLLGLGTSQAYQFCLCIQKRFKQAPSFKSIASCLEKFSPANRTEDNVVATLQSSKYKQPSKPKQYVRKPRSRSGGWHTKSEGGFTDREEPESYSPIFAHDPRKHQEGLEKCPHGVLKFQPCAICDPEKFREQTGID